MKLLSKLRGLRQKTQPITPTIEGIHHSIVFHMTMEQWDYLPEETRQGYIAWAKQNLFKHREAWYILRKANGYA